MFNNISNICIRRCLIYEAMKRIHLIPFSGFCTIYEFLIVLQSWKYLTFTLYDTKSHMRQTATLDLWNFNTNTIYIFMYNTSNTFFGMQKLLLSFCCGSGYFIGCCANVRPKPSVTECLAGDFEILKSEMYVYGTLTRWSILACL